MRHVREGPQHARDIAKRRPLLAALREAARGFALEVEDHPAATRPQHLAKVVVAVGPDRAATNADPRQRPELLADVLAAVADGRNALVLGRQVLEDPLDLLVD